MDNALYCSYISQYNSIGQGEVGCKSNTVCERVFAYNLRGDQTEVFKILNGYENIDRNVFFSLKKDSRTRGHEVKLVKDQCRLDIRKHSFSQRTINEWNKKSTDCVTASSVNMFKNKVDTYLRRAGYK